MSFTRPTLMILTGLFVGCAFGTFAQAAPIQPFDAAVQSAAGEEIYVRSGPGLEKHYPTMKLKNGDRVYVLRKDPGGWFMITPPQGSYSWILSRYVLRNGNQGTVKENGIVVRVGAFQSAQRDVEQVRLNQGDTVEILGEQILDSDKGKDQWLQIKPPRGEHRWIKGSHLVELNPDGTPKVLAKIADGKIKNIPESTGAHAVDGPQEKIASPTKPRGKAPSEGPAYIADKDLGGGNAPKFGPPGRKPETADPFADLPEGAAIAPSLGQNQDVAIREDLKILDQELAQILIQPATDWELGTQREDLESLKELAGKSPIVAQIDQRLAKLDEYQGRHDEALIMAKRARFNQSQATQPLDSAEPGATAPRVTRETQRFAPNPTAPMPAIPTAPNSPGSRPGLPTGSRFSGAGIIHRLPNAPPGTPQYVIAAPDRRILCYLDAAPGVNLEQYVGQAMGLTGPRGFDSRIRYDRMQVQSLTPVQLSR
ncbi:MAG: hypothetical protein JWN70_5550 [Planctomycetaceae bacterium]|nr:hypothetical protein [Planctomycetaceae bacterium]